MRVSMIVPDNSMVVDGVYATVDLSDLAKDNIHAIQWYDNRGEVEYAYDDVNNHRDPNQRITDFTPYDKYLVAFRERVAADNAERELQMQKALAQAKAGTATTGETHERNR